jgi:hypothetical protein
VVIVAVDFDLFVRFFRSRYQHVVVLLTASTDMKFEYPNFRLFPDFLIKKTHHLFDLITNCQLCMRSRSMQEAKRNVTNFFTGRLAITISNRTKQAANRAVASNATSRLAVTISNPPSWKEQGNLPTPMEMIFSHVFIDSPLGFSVRCNELAGTAPAPVATSVDKISDSGLRDVLNPGDIIVGVGNANVSTLSRKGIEAKLKTHSFPVRLTFRRYERQHVIHAFCDILGKQKGGAMPASAICTAAYNQARGQEYKVVVTAAGGLKQLCNDTRELEFLADDGCGRIKLVAVGETLEKREGSVLQLRASASLHLPPTGVRAKRMHKREIGKEASSNNEAAEEVANEIVQIVRDNEGLQLSAVMSVLYIRMPTAKPVISRNRIGACKFIQQRLSKAGATRAAGKQR